MDAVERLVAALGGLRVVDLSHALEEEMPVPISKFAHTRWYDMALGDPVTAYQLLINEHTGTHLDAPAHYVPVGAPNHRWVDAVPPEVCMGRAAVLRCRDLPPRGAVPAEAVLRWEAEHGAIRPGDIAVFDLGWAAKWGVRPDGAAFTRDWPGLGMDCVHLLLARGVKAIGVDTFTPDIYGDSAHPVEHAMLGAGVVQIESLANLDALPPACFLIALPLKIKGGTGSPVRAIALVPTPDPPQ